MVRHERDSRVPKLASCATPIFSANNDPKLQALAQQLAMDLRRGRHIVLWGPRGSGKSTLLLAVARELGDIHHALSETTSHLDDITQTLERAYAEVPTQGVKRRTARSRLCWAADADPGCLLLDHVTKVPAAMKGWLRRLRGGVVGVLLAVDVNSPRERQWLRGMKIGCTSLRMPPVDSRCLARLLNHLWTAAGFAPLVPSMRRTLVRNARGRPGWVVQCTTLAANRRYWKTGQLQANALSTDTEMTLRGMALPWP
jgi:energy-coupling factor transporter ATP-binding protein EcfA2